MWNDCKRDGGENCLGCKKGVHIYLFIAHLSSPTKIVNTLHSETFKYDSEVLQIQWNVPSSVEVC